MKLPSGFPSSHRELWARWLGYRIPHWDALERAVAGTLLGSQRSPVSDQSAGRLRAPPLRRLG